MMPVIFFGHGSPMNAIEDNEFTSGFKDIKDKVETPRAILVISAHWEANGTFVTAMQKPRTIHDFYGFPRILSEVEYPAPGSPELAEKVMVLLQDYGIKKDYDWGLDHGCWSILKHIYPEASIPVVQISLNISKSPQWHYDFARNLAALRSENILIIGSGNIVHNLSLIDWHKRESGSEWAELANSEITGLIIENEFQKLINYKLLNNEINRAIPTPEHFLPLLWILSLKDEKENLTIFNNKVVLGSISMASVLIGN